MTVAVGFFDGVHLGHRAILEGADAALTFAAHPLSVLVPERAPRMLMTSADRIDAIRAAGVKEVIALEFTRELASTEPEDFISHLSEKAGGGVLSFRCGENWRFGRGGRGDAELLRRMGFSVTVVPYAVLRGERISSTRVRASVESGRVEEAAEMLGRPWQMSGEVVCGKGVGREIGFPTLNVRRADGLVAPPRGVYAVKCAGARGVANWGTAPTMGERAWKAPVLEVHLLEETERLPVCGDGVKVEFLRFLREERRFGSVEELKAQIASDCARAKE